MRPFYQRLRANGKPAKVALVALMRKLAELANHLLKDPAPPSSNKAVAAIQTTARSASHSTVARLAARAVLPRWVLSRCDKTARVQRAARW